MPIESRRRGSALLEVQLAFAVLGVGLAGLCPIVVMQYRQLWILEQRFKADDYVFKNIGKPVYVWRSNHDYASKPERVYHLVPWKDPWTRKLTARACLSSTGDNPLDEGQADALPSSVHVVLKGFATSSVDGVVEVDATIELNP